MSSYTEINTDRENCSVLSTPKPCSHYTGGEDLEGFLKSYCLVRRETGTVSSPVNTQFRISEKLATNWEKPFLKPERRNHPMPSKCSQRGDSEVNNKEVDSKCSPSAIEIKS